MLDEIESRVYYPLMMNLRLVSPEQNDAPPTLHGRAIDNLQFIRETMERAAQFTMVPGWGMVITGATALLATLFAAQQTNPRTWMRVWLCEACLSLLIAGVAMWRKARRAGEALLSKPARKFALSHTPPLLAGALLTVALFKTKSFDQLSGVWLLLYGTAVVCGGAFSVRAVPIMGVCFMTLGAIALFVPSSIVPSFDAWLMATGFGGLHIGFGIYIARKHGG